MKPLLTLRGAAFGYAGRPLLQSVNLEVRAGELLGIIGPNGGGKTTLIRGILGLIPPLAGGIERPERDLGYVPQRESLDPIFPLSVQEVVQMGAYGRLSGLRLLAHAEKELARAQLTRVGLADRSHEPFSRLSGGQRQRVLIARALMSTPRLLVLDEPTSGVDHEAERRVLELLQSLCEAQGMAVLLVSHHLALLHHAVREVLLVDGGKVERGPSHAMIERLETCQHG